MPKVAAAIAVSMLCGCAHADSGRIANTLIAAAFIAVEVSAAESAAPGLFCSDDEGDPPHTCPGTTPGPASPPPPPPD